MKTRTLKNNKGFTLVELLVVVVIIGIIAIITIPSVNSIKNKNEIKQYQKYQESLKEGGELFVDSFHEDIFGVKGDGCYSISFDQLYKKNLIKDYNNSEITCRNEKTFVKVIKENGKYTYDTSIKCVDKTGKVIYEDIKEKCEPPIVENIGKPVITATYESIDSYDLEWSNSKNITVNVSADLGLNSNVVIHYGISKVKGQKPTNMKKYRYKNKYGTHNVSYTFFDENDDDGSKRNGRYYLYVDGFETYDTGAHHAENVWFGPLNYDNTPPEQPKLNNEKNGKWANKEYIDEDKYKIGIHSHDELSGVAYYQYKFPNSIDNAEKEWNTYDKLFGDDVVTNPMKTNRNENIEIRACDFANNCSTPSSNKIMIDIVPPKMEFITKQFKEGTENSDNPEPYIHKKEKKLKVEVKCTDELSGFDNKKLEKNINGSISSPNKDKKITLECKDIAGNKSTITGKFSVKIKSEDEICGETGQFKECATGTACDKNYIYCTAGGGHDKCGVTPPGCNGGGNSVVKPGSPSIGTGSGDKNTSTGSKVGECCSWKTVYSRAESCGKEYHVCWHF